MSLADLQSSLSELEGRHAGQAANVESLAATLKTKDEMIDVRVLHSHSTELSSLSSCSSHVLSDCVCDQALHQRLGQRGGNGSDQTQDQMERSLPGLPQRGRTMIGGDSQQEVN